MSLSPTGGQAKRTSRGRNFLNVNLSNPFSTKTRRCTIMKPRASRVFRKTGSGIRKKKVKTHCNSQVKKTDVTKDEKLDYFFTPFRKDYVKEHEKCMSFDQEHDYQMLDWSSISNLILSDKKKPFKLALDKLNKIKCKRFDRELYDKSDGKLKKSKFFASLMKASRRKIAHKAMNKEPNPNDDSKANQEQAKNNFMEKIFNLNRKNFQIPERRGTIAETSIKELMNIPDTLVPPSETDMALNVDIASRCLQSSQMEVLKENIEEDKVSESEKKVEQDVSKTSGKLSRVSSSSSSSSVTSVSCKYEINVNNIEVKSERSESKKLSICDQSEIEEGDKPCSAPPVQRNAHPDFSSSCLSSKSKH